MEAALRFDTHVLAGHRIEVSTPELPEGARVELIVTDISAAPCRRYPSAIELEYDALTDKELHGALTDSEVVRLNDVCTVIAEIGRLTLTSADRSERLNQIEIELDHMRHEIEDLPVA
jgi:hypothetical protein